MVGASLLLREKWLRQVFMNDLSAADWGNRIHLWQIDPDSNNYYPWPGGETTGLGYVYKIVDNSVDYINRYCFWLHAGNSVIGPQDMPDYELKWTAGGTWTAVQYLCVLNQYGNGLFCCPLFYQGNNITVYLTAGDTLTIRPATIMITLE